MPDYFQVGRSISDQITFLQGQDSRTKKASCGHDLSQSVVRNHVSKQLEEGKTEILCPKVLGNGNECKR